MKTLLLSFILFLSSVLFAQLELPKYNETDTIIKHFAYTLSYNSKYKQANWVAYLLTREETKSIYSRGNNFCADPLLNGTDFSIDYYKSGYDRGHLAPAGDMGFSEIAMNESFYYTNMSPQLPRFNRGVWKSLETQVRNWAIEYDSLYVVTGPIFSDSMKVIGPHQVAVPNAYYKVLLQKRNGEWFGIGFILPNTNSKVDFNDYATSIDKVEEKTGLDFFWGINDEIEKDIENKIVLDYLILKN